MTNIEELKALWETEKKSSEGKEIGSGVVLFVKKMLQCPELFALKEGKLITANKDRKNEYLEEICKKNEFYKVLAKN